MLRDFIAICKLSQSFGICNKNKTFYLNYFAKFCVIWYISTLDKDISWIITKKLISRYILYIFKIIISNYFVCQCFEKFYKVHRVSYSTQTADRPIFFLLLQRMLIFSWNILIDFDGFWLKITNEPPKKDRCFKKHAVCLMLEICNKTFW